jgi:hypothetical protein
MKRILSTGAFLLFIAIHLQAQSVLGLEKKYSSANLDTIIQHVSKGLGGGYGITGNNVQWMNQGATSFLRADIMLQKGWGIDPKVRRDNSEAISVTIIAQLTSRGDTVISSATIVGTWDDIKSAFFGLYKPAENPENIRTNGKSQKLILLTKNKKLDEVVYCTKVDPYRTWGLYCSLALHTDTWKPEMAPVYGTEKEMKIEENAMTATKNPYLVLLTGFKKIYAENISLYLENLMNCTLLKKLNIPGGEQFVFARNAAARDNENITLTLATDADDRIVSAKITGSIQAITELNNGYWVYVDENGVTVGSGISDHKVFFVDDITSGIANGKGYIAVKKVPGTKNTDLYLKNQN